MNPIKDNRLVNKGKKLSIGVQQKSIISSIRTYIFSKTSSICSITCISYASCDLGIIAYGNKINHAIFKERERTGLLNSANTC